MMNNLDTPDTAVSPSATSGTATPHPATTATTAAPTVTTWLDQPRHINTLIWILIFLCIGLLIIDVVYHKHGHFTFETWFGFFAGFGFASYTLIVLLSTPLRNLLKRKEDYYD